MEPEIYIGFKPTQERRQRGAKVAECDRCGEPTGYWEKDKGGADLWCGPCALEQPALGEVMNQLVQARRAN